MSKRRAQVITCDNPECATELREQIVDGDEQGYFLGKGHYALIYGGGPIPATFACSIKCIVPALENQMYEGNAAR